MPRGKRKSIADRIAEQEPIVSTLQSRLEQENEVLNDLFREKKEAEVSLLYDSIMETDISVTEAAIKRQ